MALSRLCSARRASSCTLSAWASPLPASENIAATAIANVHAKGRLRIIRISTEGLHQASSPHHTHAGPAREIGLAARKGSLDRTRRLVTGFPCQRTTISVSQPAKHNSGRDAYVLAGMSSVVSSARQVMRNVPPLHLQLSP